MLVIANLHYFASFGKLDGSGPMDWDINLTDEEAASYEEAIKLRKAFEEYPALEKPLERAYDEILEHELELFKEGGEEYWGDTYIECAGEYPVDEDELTELVHKRDEHALEFLHLTDLSDEEIASWNASDLDELPDVCDFDPNFEFKNPYEWYWSISVRYAEEPENKKLKKTEAKSTLKQLIKESDGDYSLVFDYIERCEDLYVSNDDVELADLAASVARSLELNELASIFSLANTPEEEITYEQCIKAVKANAKNFFSVPMRFRTKELCGLVAEKGGKYWRVFPPKLITSEIAYRGVMEDAYGFNWVPNNLKTKELCLAALLDGKYAYQNSEKNFKLIPKTVMDDDFYMKMVQGSYRLFEYIPEKDRNYDLCMEYVKLGGDLREIPKELLTREMCMMAVAKNGLYIGYVPKEYLDEELCMVALRKNRNAIERIPREMINEEMCKEYISTARYLASWYEKLPQDLLTQEMCLEMIKRDPVSMHCIPEKFRTEEICLICLADNPHQMKYVPSHLRTKEFYIKAKKVNPELEIPDE